MPQPGRHIVPLHPQQGVQALLPVQGGVQNQEGHQIAPLPPLQGVQQHPQSPGGVLPHLGRHIVPLAPQQGAQALLPVQGGVHYQAGCQIEPLPLLPGVRQHLQLKIGVQPQPGCHTVFLQHQQRAKALLPVKGGVQQPLQPTGVVQPQQEPLQGAYCDNLQQGLSVTWCQLKALPPLHDFEQLLHLPGGSQPQLCCHNMLLQPHHQLETMPQPGGGQPIAKCHKVPHVQTNSLSFPSNFFCTGEARWQTLSSHHDQ